MEPHPQSALRAQLTDLIELERPPWTQLIPRGRKETVDYIGTDVKQCLKDADPSTTTMRRPSSGGIEWETASAGCATLISLASVVRVRD